MAIEVLYHAECADGFGAAWSAWKKLGNVATYIPVSHGEPPPPLAPDDEVYLLDFSYPRQICLEIRDRCHRLTVLDHHQTALEELDGLDFAVLDTKHSGCVLAWQYWHPSIPVPLLLQYIQDRDLWQFKLPYSHEVFAAILSYPFEFDLWDRLASTSVDRLAAQGRPLLEKRRCEAEKMASQYIWIDLCGYRIPAARAPQVASEVAHLLCQRFPQAPFAACWRDDLEKGIRRWDLRSIGEFDVSHLARQFGGGGHKHAAGFQVPLEEANLTSR